MRNVDGRDAQFLLDGADFSAQGNADLCIQGGERLVQQEHLWAVGKRTRQGHALLLSAGELAG